RVSSERARTNGPPNRRPRAACRQHVSPRAEQSRAGPRSASPPSAATRRNGPPQPVTAFDRGAFFLTLGTLSAYRGDREVLALRVTGRYWHLPAYSLQLVLVRGRQHGRVTRREVLGRDLAARVG